MGAALTKIIGTGNTAASHAAGNTAKTLTCRRCMPRCPVSPSGTTMSLPTTLIRLRDSVDEQSFKEYF